MYEPGTATPVFDVDGLIFGIVICRDSTYQIPAQNMARRGATVLFVPTNNALAPAKAGAEVVEQARETDVSRASENGVWVVRSDVAGQANGLVSYGSSGITDRDGVLLGTARQMEPELLIVDVHAPSDCAGNRSNIQMEPTCAGL